MVSTPPHYYYSMIAVAYNHFARALGRARLPDLFGRCPGSDKIGVAVVFAYPKTTGKTPERL